MRFYYYLTFLSLVKLSQCIYDYCDYPLVQYSSMSASSWLVTREPNKAVLYETSAWTARVAIIGEYLEVDLGSTQNVTSIWTQGREDSSEYVSSYSISYSQNGQLFSHVKGYDGSIWAFDGNRDGNNIITNTFSTPIIARYIRILPLRWGERISMRIELYGCQYERETISFDGNALMSMDYSRIPIASFQDNIRFRFKTIHPNGVLMYARGSQGDYLALQLVQNRMLLNLNLGSKRMTSLSVGSLLDDNAWHDVEIQRDHRNISLIVDRVRLDDIVVGDFGRLDINKKFYIGGVPNLQIGMKARVNFTGCIENIFINGTGVIPELKEALAGYDETYYYYRPTYSRNNTEFECPVS